MSDDPEDDPQSSDSTGEVRCSFVTGDFLGFQYCFICCPTGFFVSEEVGIEPRTVVTYVLAVRCSKIFFDVNVFWFFGQISVIRILIYNLMAIFSRYHWSLSWKCWLGYVFFPRFLRLRLRMRIRSKLKSTM